MALNGYWKKCWLEALNDFQEFPIHLDKIMNFLGLTGKVPAKGFPDIKGTDNLEIHMLLQKLMGTLTSTMEQKMKIVMKWYRCLR
jgi:hypothetical protein